MMKTALGGLAMVTALEILFYLYPTLLLGLRCLFEKHSIPLAYEVIVSVLILVPIYIFVHVQFKKIKEKL